MKMLVLSGETEGRPEPPIHGKLKTPFEAKKFHAMRRIVMNDPERL